MRYVSPALRGIGRAAVAIIRALPVLARDVTGLFGAGLVVYGIWQMHRPAAFIAGGAMLFMAAWLSARKTA